MNGGEKINTLRELCTTMLESVLGRRVAFYNGSNYGNATLALSQA